MPRTPPRHVVILVNPTSGRGRGAQFAPVAIDRLRARGVEVAEALGVSATEAVQSAAEAIARGTDALVACGGDGTVHAALQLVAGTDIPLGVIPVGTGDDNARSLGLPLDDAAAAADVIADGEIRVVDAGYVETADETQRWFLGVMSSGFDSLVNERANNMSFPKGQARYAVATVAELSVFKPLPYDVTVDGLHHQGEAMLVAVGNGASYGGGMRVCPAAVLDDGLLEVTFLGKVSKATFLRVFPRVFSGTHVEHPAVMSLRGAHITLDAPGQVVYADGERVGPLPATVQCRPGAVRAFVPATS